MLRPRIQAPMPAKASSAIWLSTPVSPPSWPCILRQTRVAKNHSISSGPPTPRGFCWSWFGPAPKPSREIAKLRTSSFDMLPPGQKSGILLREHVARGHVRHELVARAVHGGAHHAHRAPVLHERRHRAERALGLVAEEIGVQADREREALHSLAGPTGTHGEHGRRDVRHPEERPSVHDAER